MVDRRELINVFRQIGIMMQAGVDFLRITHVLRAQTENPRLAALYNALDHDLTMGMSLADAMARQPDIFSPFAVSLVRQTEMRSDMAEMSHDLAAAFLRVADYLQQENASARTPGTYSAAPTAPAQPTPVSAQEVGKAGLTPAANPGLSPHTRLEAGVSPALDSVLAAELERWSATLRLVALRALLVLFLLCLALAAIEASVALGWLAARWQGVALWSAGALFTGGATLWMWQLGQTPGAAAKQPDTSHAVSAEAPLELPPVAPAATIDAAAPNEAELGESWAVSSAAVEPDATSYQEPASSPVRGNWADLKRVAPPSALPIWAREEEAANLPPLPTGSGPFFVAPPDSATSPTPHPDAASPEEADYD